VKGCSVLYIPRDRIVFPYLALALVYRKCSRESRSHSFSLPVRCYIAAYRQIDVYFNQSIIYSIIYLFEHITEISLSQRVFKQWSMGHDDAAIMWMVPHLPAKLICSNVVKGRMRNEGKHSQLHTNSQTHTYFYLTRNLDRYGLNLAYKRGVRKEWFCIELPVESLQLFRLAALKTLLLRRHILRIVLITSPTPIFSNIDTNTWISGIEIDFCTLGTDFISLDMKSCCGMFFTCDRAYSSTEGVGFSAWLHFKMRVRP